jgi:tRNA threonylcarbamoyl adenosine modification protein YjeE
VLVRGQALEEHRAVITGIEGNHQSASPRTTEELGERLGSVLRAGDVVLLEGDLAAGKTTFVRGLTRGLQGDPDEVSSPTFVILQTYSCDHPRIARLHHLDLYRLEDDPRALYAIGIEEIMSDPWAVVAVEWPSDAALSWRPADARLWRIELILKKDGNRTITIDAPRG